MEIVKTAYVRKLSFSEGRPEPGTSHRRQGLLNLGPRTPYSSFDRFCLSTAIHSQSTNQYLTRLLINLQVMLRVLLGAAGGGDGCGGGLRRRLIWRGSCKAAE